jgi:hypothetical protein
VCHRPGAVVVGALIGVVVNTGLVTYLLRRLTIRSPGWREVILGAAIAAIASVVRYRVGTSWSTARRRGHLSSRWSSGRCSGLPAVWEITLYGAELNIILIKRR